MQPKQTLWIAALAVAAMAGPVAAQTPITFEGTGTGCFGFGCTPSGSSAGQSFFSGTDILDFTGSAFSGVTSGGALDLTFGYFNWRSFSGTHVIIEPFTLFLNFALPTGISPDPTYGGGALGLIQVQGSFWSDPFSLSAVIFQPNVRTYGFTGGNPDGAGQFTLTLNNTYLGVTGDSYLTGSISRADLAGGGTVTPEPITMILLGSGLAGVAAARRRRRDPEGVQV